MVSRVQRMVVKPRGLRDARVVCTRYVTEKKLWTKDPETVRQSLERYRSQETSVEVMDKRLYVLYRMSRRWCRRVEHTRKVPSKRHES